MDIRRFSLARTVAPATPIMSLAEGMAHLRVDDMTEAAYISTLIDAVGDAIETLTHRAMIQQTWRYSTDRFPYPYPSNGYGYIDPLFLQTPSAGGWLAEPIRLPRPNLMAVTSVKYLDVNGTQQTLSPSVYTVSTDELFGTISLAFGQSWPNALYLRNSIIVTYDAGFGADATAVPASIVVAAKLLLGDLYVNRESSVDGLRANVNPQVEAMLGPYVVRDAL